MLGIAKFLALFVAATGLFLWGKSVMPALPQKVAVADIPEALVAAPLPASDDGQATIEGIVLLSSQIPGVPYIEYSDEDDATRSKQLIISGGRGCSPEAADLPCASGGSGDYPRLAGGERIRVTGRVVGDQIFVTRLERR
jgi:hypothetical protein